MVLRCCQHLSVVTPCSVRTEQRILTASRSYSSVIGRQAAHRSPRSRIVCFHNPTEHPPKDAAQDAEEPVQHTHPIKKEDAAFGPRGMLLAGFNEEDAKKTAEWMQQMEADFKVSHVVDDMVNEPLGEALYNPDSQEMREEAWQQTRTLCPRICIMSGLTGEEQIAIAEAWEEFAGSPTPFFAAAVPNSLGESVKTILQAIVDENARNMEDDPRLDPSNFLSTVDMAKLRVQVQRKLREKGITAPGDSQSPSQASGQAATGSSNGTAAGSTKGRGFG